MSVSEKISIFVADGDMVSRRSIIKALSALPLVEIAGFASDCQICSAKMSGVKPDVILLDVQLPGSDALSMIKDLRVRRPDSCIIIMSTASERLASTAFDAISSGAADYIVKPQNMNDQAAVEKFVSADIIPRIKACSEKNTAEVQKLQENKASAIKKDDRKAVAFFDAEPDQRKISRPAILAIGSSTGGPDILMRLLKLLKSPFPVPILITQHMPPVFTRILSERLAACTGHRVIEGKDGCDIESGKVFIAPGNHHMTIRREGVFFRLSMNQDPPENSCRPAVDPMFRSVADIYGRSALAVVLTGMGQDGTLGAIAIRRAGGFVLVQDRESSVVWGMPGSVAEAGLADGIMSVELLADEIARRLEL